MNKKILFFDIDGTILQVPNQPNPSKELKDAITKLRNNGHLCFIATDSLFNIRRYSEND